MTCEICGGRPGAHEADCFLAPPPEPVDPAAPAHDTEPRAHVVEDPLAALEALEVVASMDRAVEVDDAMPIASQVRELSPPPQIEAPPQIEPEPIDEPTTVLDLQDPEPAMAGAPRSSVVPLDIIPGEHPSKPKRKLFGKRR